MSCMPLHGDGLSENVLPLMQGKRHQQNMAKRAAREAADKPAQPQPQRRAAVKKTVKIGRPGYRVTKQYDAEQDQRSLLFQVGAPTHCLCCLGRVPTCNSAAGWHTSTIH